MGQMASLLTERQRGALPSNSEVNPRQEGNEHVKAVTLRSGKELAVSGQPLVIGEVKTKEVIQPSQTDKVVREQPYQKKLGEKETDRTEPTIPILYPQRLKKSKLDKQFTKLVIQESAYKHSVCQCIRADAQLHEIHEGNTVQEKKTVGL